MRFEFCLPDRIIFGPGSIAEIGEEAKPKQRSGDLATCEGEPRVLIYDRRADEMVGYDPRTGQRAGIETGGIYETTGPNIFDDLKALQEDVTEVEAVCWQGVDRIKVKINPMAKDIIKISICGEDVRLKFKDFSAFILKLRQMEATLKRKSNT